MANRANQKLQTITDRNLPASRDATDLYCYSITPGKVLGFCSAGHGKRGSWVARVEIEENGKRARRRKLLGASCLLANEADANGKDILSYQQALAQATTFDPKAEANKPASALSLLEAIEQHYNFDGRNGDKTARAKDAAVRNLKSSVLGIDNRTGKIRPGVVVITATTSLKDLGGEELAINGSTAVNDLTDEMLKALRDSWIDDENLESSRASALRKWTDLHSCLQQAFLKKSNGIPANSAWAQVAKMKQKFNARLLHFSDAQAIAIIDHARAIDAAVADYFEALYRTGARPGGEMKALEVRDFDAEVSVLSIHGRSETNCAKTGGRDVGISPLAAALFRRLTAGRRAGEAMFDVEIFQRGRIKTVLLAAVRAVLGQDAPEDDADIVPYSFRHTFISRRAGSGKMSAGQIAEVCGTSEYMINKVYKKMFRSEVAAALAASDPKPVLRVVQDIAA